ncbi:hypothetical protein PENANT_c012G07089 [Penicillium antarcticum]|uniref:Uncharacterized protein n=2 Tax=Penicillium antarcticum TaxID=416450 RepID=A0A1V6Q6B7_9EURO|nr:hypothetical protein PENANT_c012G07089 [Penicillium antarcticum]
MEKSDATTISPGKVMKPAVAANAKSLDVATQYELGDTTGFYTKLLLTSSYPKIRIRTGDYRQLQIEQSRFLISASSRGL